MRVLPARTGLFLIGLIGLLLRFCPRNGGADAVSWTPPAIADLEREVMEKARRLAAELL